LDTVTIPTGLFYRGWVISKQDGLYRATRMLDGVQTGTLCETVEEAKQMIDDYNSIFETRP
jgi:hypothetical protein